MKIQIHKPCPENWNNMMSADGGKYCTSCDKVVIDFTLMSEGEIKEYFLAHTTEKTCGQFKVSQLHVSEGKSVVNILNRWKEQLTQGSSYRLFSKVAISLIGTALLMAGCKNGDERTECTGDTINVPVQERTLDSAQNIQRSNSSVIRCEESIMGEFTPETDSAEAIE